MVDSPNRSRARVGVEISNTALTSVVINEADEIAASHSVVVESGGDVIEKLAELIREIDAQHGRVDRLGVSIPGLVDRRTGRVAFSAIVPQQSDVALGDAIVAATGREVVIENDANAAAYGEFRLGAGRGASDMFYATLGEGVGGAFIFGGEIWHGASGFAGEFGYVQIDGEGTKLEDVASAANILRRTRSRVQQDNASSLSRVKEADLSLSDIILAAQDHDEFAKMMLERTGRHVGTAVASVINLLNIERIVVGGSIMQANTTVIDALVERAKALSFAPSFASTTIIEGELGANAAAIGAAFISGGE
jgi:glucokinase